MGAAYDRAQILYNLHRYEQALKEFQQELATTPDSAPAHSKISLCQMHLGNYPSARISAERAIQAAPEYDWGYYALACALYYDMQFTSARENDIPQNVPIANPAQYRLKPAAAAVKEALRLSPRNPELHMLHSGIAFDDFDPQTALNAVNDGLAIDPGSQGCLRMRALVLRYFGDFPGARDAAAQALAIDPTSSANHVTAGWTALWAGRHAGARVHFAEALRTSPNSAPARQGMLWAMRSRYFFFWPVIWVIRPVRKYLLRIVRFRSKSGSIAPAVILCCAFSILLCGLPLVLFIGCLTLVFVADYFLLFNPVGCTLLTRAMQEAAVAYCSVAIFLCSIWPIIAVIFAAKQVDDPVYLYMLPLSGLLIPYLLFKLRPRRLRIAASLD